MRLTQVALATGIASAMMLGAAEASYIINIDQSASDIIVHGGGRLDLAGMSQLGMYYLNTGVRGNTTYIGSGGFYDNVYGWHGLSGPNQIGTGGLTSPTSYSGTDFGFNPARGNLYFQGNLFDPRYLDNVYLYFSSTYAGQTFSSLGLNRGIYTYTLPSDTIILNVGNVSAVPLPASAPMFGAALFALAVFGYGLDRWIAPKSKTAAAT